MSSYLGPAYNPVEKVIRAAFWMDDYFGPHQYGVRFDECGEVFREDRCKIPIDKTFVLEDVAKDRVNDG